MNRFWCITAIFNPSGYASRIANYQTFKERLEKQNIKLLTVELTFNDQKHTLPPSETVLHLRSNSVMWQKERLLNYAISNLPHDCDRFAWVDADLLLPDGWDRMLMDKLDHSDFVQLFQTVSHLAQDDREYHKESQNVKQGVIWQKKTHDNWLENRISRKLLHAEPGFGWGAVRAALPRGLYDRLIVGSGDNFLVDCLLESRVLHHYWMKLTDHMLNDLEEWKLNFIKETDRSVDYLPINVCHLWHGSMKDRAYHTRDLIFREHDFDPKKDIKMVNNVWEWSTNKPQFHQSIVDYFHNRKEDGK